MASIMAATEIKQLNVLDIHCHASQTVIMRGVEFS